MAIEKPWEVVSDPTSEFQPGARFGHEEFQQTTHFGYWPKGIVFKNIRTGAKIKVTGRTIESLGRKLAICHKKSLHNV